VIGCDMMAGYTARRWLSEKNKSSLYSGRGSGFQRSSSQHRFTHTVREATFTFITIFKLILKNTYNGAELFLKKINDIGTTNQGVAMHPRRDVHSGGELGYAEGVDSVGVLGREVGWINGTSA
jgi:hypothetical protein